MLDAPRLSFQRISALSILAVYLLFFIGASVRASGAGMGCPDWPTCFGQWIPPTHVSQLPNNYQDIYLGYANKPFNAIKTWTEYLNRLSGVITGLLIIATALASVRIKRHYPNSFYASMAALVLVILQGWIGSQVVASQLTPGVITLHMLVAIVILGLLIFAKQQAHIYLHPDPLTKRQASVINRFLLTLCLFIIGQIFLGTQVREMIDFATNQQLHRSQWLDLLPSFFYVHRSFSSVVLFTHLALLWYLLKQFGWQHALTRLQTWLLIAVITTIVIGAILNHGGFPAYLQPFHLLAAAIIFGLQLQIVLTFFKLRQLRDAIA